MHIRFNRVERSRIVKNYDLSYGVEDLERFISQFQIQNLTVDELIEIFEKNDDDAVRMAVRWDDTLYTIFVLETLKEYMIDEALDNGPTDSDTDWDSDSDYDCVDSFDILIDEIEEPSCTCGIDCDCSTKEE